VICEDVSLEDFLLCSASINSTSRVANFVSHGPSDTMKFGVLWVLLDTHHRHPPPPDLQRTPHIDEYAFQD
jgi:hypothetical protein